MEKFNFHKFIPKIRMFVALTYTEHTIFDLCVAYGKWPIIECEKKSPVAHA